LAITADDRSAALPLDQDQRIDALDILRGFALLGMFVVHFHVNSTDPGGVDEAVRLLVWRLVETKSHGTFALLFGAGFAVQLRRAEARGQPFAALYLRRIAVLALLGFAAHAFFGYNVLLGYAIWAVPLLLIRTWSTRALLAAAVVSSVSVALFYLAFTSYHWLVGGSAGVEAAYEARVASATAINGAVEAAEAQDSYRILLGARLRHMAWFYTQPFLFMPGVTLTLFIAGLLMVRHGVFERPGEHRRLLGALAAFGIASWAAANWLLPSLDLGGLGLVRDQWLMFAYVAGAVTLLDRRPGLASRLRPVAAAGRMALTNYLLQIAALDLLFSGYAIGMGQIRPVYGLPAALACFAAIVVFSTAWLAQFRFGPAEWLWRSLTYGRPQPMRRAARPPMPAAAV
jgi:uncharacterized protein